MPFLIALFAMLVASGDVSAPVVRLTINPEARVSAVRVAALPPQRCGGKIELPIAVDNQARIRAPLRTAVDPVVASFVDTDTKLDGNPHQELTLVLRLRRPGSSLLAVEFDAGPGTGDLAGRNEVDIAVSCLD